MNVVLRFSVFGIACFLAGCGTTKVDLPSSDSTPPTLKWSVLNDKTGERIEYTQNTTIAAKWGDSFTVTLIATDPQGVKKIQTKLEGGWSCRPVLSNENVESASSLTTIPSIQSLSPDKDGKVLTSIFMIDNVGLGFKCQKGWVLKSGALQLNGQALNYFGGTASSSLKFSVVP